MGTNANQRDEADARLAGDLLVSADAIHDYLVFLGMPEDVNPYYLKRSGWPIGSSSGNGGKLIASKKRLVRHVEKLTAPTS